MLGKDDVDIKREAIWAVSNATSQATPDQFKKRVDKGIIGALCSVLSFQDARVLAVALEGLENILKDGQVILDANGDNPYAMKLELDGGIEKLEALQMHPNHQIYDRTVKILEKYF